MKKRLFITSALMTAVMAASLATGTFAWYQSSSGASLSATGMQNAITTNNGATIGAQEFTANFANVEAVDLTDPTDGNVYVWNGANKVLSTSAGTTVCDVTLTFTGLTADKLKPYAGTYEVKVKSTKFLRIGAAETISSVCFTSGAVKGNTEQLKYGAVEYEIVVGNIIISPEGVLSYDSLWDKNGAGAADEGLYFKLSISPLHDDAEEGVTAGEDTDGTNYGNLSVGSITLKTA